MLTKEQLINKLSDRERFCLIAYLQTGDQLTAYICSRKKPVSANNQSLIAMASRWINSEPVQAFLEAERGRKAALIEDAENRSKADTIRELNKLASLTNDTKLKAEILLKLSDLEGWKKEKEQTQDDTIRYYLPLRCNVCSLYKAAKEAKGGTISLDESERVAPTR